jgi:hypothetical protein
MCWRAGFRPQYGDRLEWAGGPSDPHRYDLDEADQACSSRPGARSLPSVGHGTGIRSRLAAVATREFVGEGARLFDLRGAGR